MIERTREADPAERARAAQAGLVERLEETSAGFEDAETAGSTERDLIAPCDCGARSCSGAEIRANARLIVANRGLIP